MYFREQLSLLSTQHHTSICSSVPFSRLLQGPCSHPSFTAIFNLPHHTFYEITLWPFQSYPLANPPAVQPFSIDLVLGVLDPSAIYLTNPVLFFERYELWPRVCERRLGITFLKLTMWRIRPNPTHIPPAIQEFGCDLIPVVSEPRPSYRTDQVTTLEWYDRWLHACRVRRDEPDAQRSCDGYHVPGPEIGFRADD